jgi:hypothetical protein
MIDLAEVNGLLQTHGLVVLGLAETSAQDQKAYLALVGNTGSDMWSAFLESPEFAEGEPDPLDRWSRRIGSAIAATLGAEVVFPFDGPPYPPFLRWAQQTGLAFPSPLSMFIHKHHGLWHAYRFALQLQGIVTGHVTRQDATSPCLSCETRPCLDACPVDAFSTDVYKVDDCVAYLREQADSICRKMGCKARRACPVAVENQYLPDHAQFHMEAFVRSWHEL